MLRITRTRHKPPNPAPRIILGALLFLAVVTAVAYASVSGYLERATAVKRDSSAHVNFAPPAVSPRRPSQSTPDRPPRPTPRPAPRPPVVPSPVPPPAPAAPPISSRGNATPALTARAAGPTGQLGGAAASGAPVDAIVAAWASSLRARQLDAHIAYYDEHLQRYFKQTDVSKASVYADKADFLKRFPQIVEYDVRNVGVRYPAPGIAVAVFDKIWDFRTTDHRSFAGDEQEQLALRQVDGRWRITAEQENTVYWARYP